MKSRVEKRILSLFKDHILYLIFAFLLLIMATGLTIPIPLLSKKLINSIFNLKSAVFSFKIYVFLFLFLSLLKEFLIYISYYLFETRMRIFSASLRKLLFEVIQNNYNQFSFYESGRILTYISSDTERLQTFFYPTFVFFLKDLLTFGFALILGFFLNTITILISILPLFAFLVLIRYINPIVRELTYKTIETQTEFVSRLKEYIEGMEMFRVYLKEKFSIAKFKEFNMRYVKSDVKRIKSIVLFNIPLAILFNSGYIIAILMGAYYIKNGVMQAGDLVAILMVVNYLYDSSKNFWDFNIHRQEVKVVFRRLSEVLDDTQRENQESRFKQPLKNKIDSIKVRVPSFSYEGVGELLKNVKLEAKKGEIIGLFGKSGGGKSTIIKVILGFLGGNENYVKINNIPLRELELDSYYRRICYVPQHPVVFKGTVKENIFLGDNGKLDKMLLEFLDDLSLEREVEEGWRNLSGGELQRIAIVRAFVQKNKDLYLLDEPTTHLDIKKTEKLRELISLKSKNSIILIVSHSKIFLEKTCNKIVEI